MILNDKQITALCPPMITPFVPDQIRVHELTGQKVISYGLSSFGYDIRLGYRSGTPDVGKMIGDRPYALDPKDSGKYPWIWHTSQNGDRLSIPPGGFILGESVEFFNMPEDVIGIVTGKSTYARCGLIINVTPLEPGWRGFLTLELHNASRHHLIVYPGEGIAQVNFHHGDSPSVNYASRSGKYQDAQGVELPKV